MPSVNSHLPLSRQLTFAFLVLLAASVGTSVSAARLGRFPGDLPTTQWVQSISLPLFNDAMKGVSAVGWWVSGSIITLCLGLVLVALGRRWDAGLFVALVSVSAGLNWVIKRAIASPRPDPALVEVREELTTYGFPSGHVMFAVVCFGGLVIVLSGFGDRYVVLRRIAQVILVLLVAAMAMSRVYLGVHWPSDAVGALVMGGAWLVVMIGLRGWLQRKQRGVLESPRPP